MLSPDEVLVATVNGVFGVRGEVRLFLHDRQSRTLDRPTKVTLIAPEGERRAAEIAVRSGAGKRVIARISGVETPEAAHALIGWSVIVPRSALPVPAPGEYYIHDLLDLPVFERRPEGDARIGALADVVTGERDIWVITGEDGEERYLLAAPDTVLEVDLAAGRLIVAPGAAEAAE